MPIVQLPDGRQVKFPDSMSNTDIETAIEGIIAPEKPKPDNRSFINKAHEYITGATDEAVNTMTFGLGDKLAGAGSAAAEYLFGDEDKVSDAYQQPKQKRREFGERYPKTSTVASVVGGMANPAGVKVGKWMSGASTVPRLMGRGAAGGSAIAATQAGVENADDPNMTLAQKLGAMGNAGLAGGAVGAAIPPLVKGVPAGFNWMMDKSINRLPFRQDTAAARKLAQTLYRDNVTPQAGAQRLKEMGPDAAIMDLGPNTQSLTHSAYGIPGKGKPVIEKFVRNRQEGVRGADKVLSNSQSQRIQTGIDNLIPEQRIAKNTERVRKLYKQAYQANPQVESNEIDLILKTPAGKQAFRDAVKQMQNDRALVSKADPEMTALLDEAIADGQALEKTGFGVGRGLKLQTLDYVKRSLGDIEKGLMRKEGRESAARSVGNLRRALTRELDDIDVTGHARPNSLKPEGGAYARARKLAGDDFAHDDAFQLGTQFMRGGKLTTAKDLQETLSTMSEGQLHEFRQGMAQSIKSHLDNLVVRADSTKRVMDIPGLEKKIMQGFGSKETFRKYISMLENEKQMFDTYAKVMGNSKTAERIAAMEDAGVDPGKIIEAMQQMSSSNPANWGRAAMNLLGGAKNRLNMTPQMSGKLANLLTGRDFTPLQQTYKRTALGNEGQRFLADQLTRGLAAYEGAEIGALSSLQKR